MGQHKEAVRLKGCKNGLIARLEAHSSLEEIKEDLAGKLEKGKKFFQGAGVLLDLGGRQGRPEEIEEICRIFTEQGLVLEGILPREDPGGADEKTREEREEPAGTDDEKPREEGGEPKAPALVLRRTLRSGQKVTSAGTVIILGDVNPGAEIAAAGHIIVMGKLRGVAHAGVPGNNEALVAALSLEASQLRIGKYMARSPDHPDTEGVGPEWARLKEGRIVISPLNRD